MMYPFLILKDGTAITHSERKPDGTVRVHVEKADPRDLLHTASCWLPGYRWEDVSGFSSEELGQYEEIIRTTAHLIMNLSQGGSAPDHAGARIQTEAENRIEHTADRDVSGIPVLPKTPPSAKDSAMRIYESAEDYLENILVLQRQIGRVRSIDIVHKMNFSKPSVSVAMKKLRENGYIEMDAEGYITLLPPGEEIARRIYGRHCILSWFLEYLGVDPTTAVTDACKIEHDISTESFEKLVAFVQTLGLNS